MYEDHARDESTEPITSQQARALEEASRTLTNLAAYIQDRSNTFYATAHLAAKEGDLQLAELAQDFGEHCSGILQRIFAITHNE